MRPERSQNWFFLRGLVRESADWGDFAASFVRGVPAARVICLDLPGNGKHHGISAPLSTAEMLAFTRSEFRRALDQQAKEGRDGADNFVLALSLGAMVATQWMQSHPEELKGAVLINTSLRGFSPFYHRLSPGAYPILLRLFLTTDTRRREELILRLTSKRPALSPSVLEERVEARVLRPVSRWNAIRQLFAAASTGVCTQAPSVPVLLLNSLGDQLVHPDCSERLRVRWKVPMKRHAWAGHDLPLDDPDWVVTAVTEWLAALASPASQAEAR